MCTCARVCDFSKTTLPGHLNLIVASLGRELWQQNPKKIILPLATLYKIWGCRQIIKPLSVSINAPIKYFSKIQDGG